MSGNALELQRWMARVCLKATQRLLEPGAMFGGKGLQRPFGLGADGVPGQLLNNAST